MPPTLIVIRHAEALHNVTRDYTLEDPLLSPLGVQQCAQLNSYLREKLPIAQQIEAIFVSPMRRTLQTALLSFDWLIDRGIKLTPHAKLQGKYHTYLYIKGENLKHHPENSLNRCDIGSPLTLLAAEYPSIDFTTVDPLFPSKTGPYAWTKKAIFARGRAMLAELHARPEKVIAVVSHASFLRTGMTKRKFWNADVRIFEFDGKVEDGEFVLREWKSTEEGGGWLGRDWSGFAGIEKGEFLEEE